jgi:hypothetical protein
MTTRDPLNIRLLAATMITLDVVSSCLVAESIYYYLIPRFGSLVPLEKFTLELSTECSFSAFITFISQLFFARQLYFVTKNKKIVYLPILVTLCAITAFAFGLACAVSMIVWRHAVLGVRDPMFTLFFGLQKGFSAITDIIATVALCTYLSASRTGIDRTNSLIKSLMEYTIQRGTLVTLIQTVLVVMFFAAPGHVYWLAVHINLTKLYANVFFAILNARNTLHKKHGMNLTTSVQFSAAGPPDAFRVDDGGKSMPMVTKSVIVSDL